MPDRARRLCPERAGPPPVRGKGAGSRQTDSVNALRSVAVEVWRFHLDLAPAPLAELGGMLSLDERARAARFHFDRDRRRFTAARGSVRCVLGRYLGIPASALTFGYDSHGKPYLTGSHGIDLRFNVAHSGEVALLAVTDGVDVGVDVEVPRELPDRRQLAARFFAESETAAIEAVPEALRHQAFFTCWTRKEAYIKAIGLGLSAPLDSFEVSVVPGEPAALLRIHGSADAAGEWSLHDLSNLPDYAAAMAVRTPRAQVITRDIDGAAI